MWYHRSKICLFIRLAAVFPETLSQTFWLLCNNKTGPKCHPEMFVRKALLLLEWTVRCLQELAVIVSYLSVEAAEGYCICRDVELQPSSCKHVTRLPSEDPTPSLDNSKPTCGDIDRLLCQNASSTILT